MTATARQVLTRALRRIRVISEGETPSAEMADDALEVMNTMMFGWNASGILYAHVALGLDSTVNVPDEQIGFVRDLLCEQLAEEYAQTLGPIMQRSIITARSAMTAAYFIPVVAPVDSAIGRRAIITGQWGPGDVLSINGQDWLAVD